LKIADLLADGPLHIDEISKRVNIDPDKIYRIMRYLSSQGVFKEGKAREFAQTPLSEQLQANVAGTFHAYAEWISSFNIEANHLSTSALQDNEIPFNKAYGMPVFEYLANNPDIYALAERGWLGLHGSATEAILDACNISETNTFADIGGGHGDVVMGVLNRYPDMHGILFDAPSAIDQAKKTFEGSGLADRCKLVSGDFFQEIPVNADCYFLKYILHDWNDEECITILRNIAASAKAGARVLIAESVIGEANQPDVGKILDLVMMTYLTGKERTLDAFRALLDAVGFEYVGLTSTNHWVSVVEGRVR
jgi:ubiquinone/menaquinone biosynthesis C-methylase UbiE